MKIGDVITCCGPSDTIVSGVVVHVEPMKTRSGWSVVITATSVSGVAVSGELAQPQAFIIRPEDEGITWIYGEDVEQVDAMRVAWALGEHTEVARKPPLRARVRNKRGTL